MSRAGRRAAVGRGRWAETLAVWLLRLKFYRILARDLRRKAGEIDILARRGNILVAVEVKRRADLALAAASISARQRARIAQVAEAHRARLPDGAQLTLRFDAILVAPGQWPRHLVDAWRP